MPTKSIDYDLDDFDLDEIIEHLSWNSNELTRGQVAKIKSVINDAEESLSDTPSNSMIDQMKMEVILQHLDKYDYLQICEMFEGKLPYQTPSK